MPRALLRLCIGDMSTNLNGREKHNWQARAGQPGSERVLTPQPGASLPAASLGSRTSPSPMASLEEDGQTSRIR